MRLKAGTTIFIIFLAGALVVYALPLLTANRASAWAQQAPKQSQCDFLNVGGFIIHDGAQANFGVAGGCKHGSPTWGHLEYIDHGIGLNIHSTSITAYMLDITGDPNARLICGTARTNQSGGDVNFVVRTGDAGEPGINDQFDIRLKDQSGVTVYDTATEEGFLHFLGSSAPGSPGDGSGGNIQLHKPNPSTTGEFGGSCPAL